MKEIVAFKIDLFELFTRALGENKVARSAIAGTNRCLTVGCHMFAIVATETPIPIFVTRKIRMRTPVCFHFGEKVGTIDGLRFADDRSRDSSVGISFA